MSDNVRKSPDGWARFRERTDNGQRKRPAYRPAWQYRPKIRPKG